MHVDDLTYAAEANEAATIERAIESGFALDTLDRFGRTALLVAAHNGRLGIAQRLIAAGASPTAHATDAEVKYRLGAKPRTELVGRWTLLHSAALGGDVETIAWLIDTLGLGVGDRDHGGWTPLHVAAGVVVARNGDKATVRFDSLGEKTLLARVITPVT